MTTTTTADNRRGQRFVVAMPVQAEWSDAAGNPVIADGETENVGPDGALVHLPQLPRVGDKITLSVSGDAGTLARVAVDVLRIERNPSHPLAALQLVTASDEWRGRVWETASVLASQADEDDFELD